MAACNFSLEQLVANPAFFHADTLQCRTPDCPYGAVGAHPKETTGSALSVEVIAKAVATALDERDVATKADRDALQLQLSLKSYRDNPALALVESTAGSGSKDVHGLGRHTLQLFDGKCLLCGTTNNISAAHIVGFPKAPDAHKQAALEALNPPNYPTEFHDCVKNRMALCGQKDVVGSCHWAYDHHYVAIYYHSFTNKICATWIAKAITNAVCFDRWDGATKVLDSPQSWGPYKRALAVRAIKSVNSYFKESDANIAEMLAIVDASALSADEESRQE